LKVTKDPTMVISLVDAAGRRQPSAVCWIATVARRMPTTVTRG
jgi:hypothetical protein